jgi:hypothetical protein
VAIKHQQQQQEPSCAHTHSLFLRIPLPPYKRKRSVSSRSTTGRGSDKRRERTGREAKIISNARHTLGKDKKSQKEHVLEKKEKNNHSRKK